MSEFKKWVEEASKVLTFPRSERSKIEKKIRKGEAIYLTTTDLDKFKVGEKLRTAWGYPVKVSKIDRFEDPEQHPMKFKLDPETKDTIKGKPYQVVKLECYYPNS